MVAQTPLQPSLPMLFKLDILAASILDHLLVQPAISGYTDRSAETSQIAQAQIPQLENNRFYWGAFAYPLVVPKAIMQRFHLVALYGVIRSLNDTAAMGHALSILENYIEIPPQFYDGFIELNISFRTQIVLMQINEGVEWATIEQIFKHGVDHESLFFGDKEKIDKLALEINSRWDRIERYADGEGDDFDVELKFPFDLFQKDLFLLVAAICTVLNDLYDPARLRSDQKLQSFDSKFILYSLVEVTKEQDSTDDDVVEPANAKSSSTFSSIPHTDLSGQNTCMDIVIKKQSESCDDNNLNLQAEATSKTQQTPFFRQDSAITPHFNAEIQENFKLLQGSFTEQTINFESQEIASVNLPNILVISPASPVSHPNLCLQIGVVPNPITSMISQNSWILSDSQPVRINDENEDINQHPQTPLLKKRQGSVLRTMQISQLPASQCQELDQQMTNADQQDNRDEGWEAQLDPSELRKYLDLFLVSITDDGSNLVDLPHQLHLAELNRLAVAHCLSVASEFRKMDIRTNDLRMTGRIDSLKNLESFYPDSPNILAGRRESIVQKSKSQEWTLCEFECLKGAFVRFDGDLNLVYQMHGIGGDGLLSRWDTTQC